MAKIGYTSEMSPAISEALFVATLPFPHPLLRILSAQLHTPKCKGHFQSPLMTSGTFFCYPRSNGSFKRLGFINFDITYAIFHY